jgi:hypothetical protein
MRTVPSLTLFLIARSCDTNWGQNKCTRGVCAGKRLLEIPRRRRCDILKQPKDVVEWIHLAPNSSCEHSNENELSIKCGEFLHYVRKY